MPPRVQTINPEPGPATCVPLDGKARCCTIPPGDRRWDDFVASHPEGCLSHQTIWQRVLEESFPHVSGHLLALEETQTGRIVAGLPIYLVRSWAIANRLICVPFAAWCDPLAASEREFALLLKAARTVAEETSAKFLEIRVRRSAELAQACGLVQTRRWLHHYILLDRPIQELWRNLSRTAVRRLVRGAERAGVEVTRERSSEALLSFHQMLSRTRHHMGLPQIPFRYFHSIQKNLAEDGHVLLLARCKGQSCGGVLATRCSATFHLEYAGVPAGRIPQGTMQLLYWKAMELAHEQACREFSFGRTDPNQSGLVAYKRHWGCVEEALSEFRTVAGKSAVATGRNGSAARIARMVMRRLPAPVYRLAGDIIFHHR